MHQWEKKSHSEKINGKLFNDKTSHIFFSFSTVAYSRGKEKGIIAKFYSLK